MNKELKDDLGRAAVAFTEENRRYILAGSHNFTEYWANADVVLFATFQDVLVKHKDKHTFEEMVFFSLIMGRAAHETIEELRRFEEGVENSEES